MSADGNTICQLDDIEDGGSAAFSATLDGTETALAAVRRGDRVFVYINVCPHIGSPLDFSPGQFLSLDRAHIQCSTHGALFRIKDGHCISGPCAGAGLTPVAVRVENGAVVLV